MNYITKQPQPHENTNSEEKFINANSFEAETEYI